MEDEKKKKKMEMPKHNDLPHDIALSVLLQVVCYCCFQWNISDYFYQKRDVIIGNLASTVTEEEQSKQTMPPFDGLWMCLFTKVRE